jgi:glycine hydroxymethyltransferase
MGKEEFSEIGDIIAERLLNPEDAAIAEDCRQRVAQLCERFPLYPHLQAAVPVLV